MLPFEQVFETVGKWPPSLRRYLRERLELWERQDAAQPPAVPFTAQPGQTETVEQQVARFNKARQWIDEHRAEYLSQWVVLDGDRLISHGTDGEQVYDQAKAAGINVPFLVRISEEPRAFMTGIL